MSQLPFFQARYYTVGGARSSSTVNLVVDVSCFSGCWLPTWALFANKKKKKKNARRLILQCSYSAIHPHNQKPFPAVGRLPYQILLPHWRFRCRLPFSSLRFFSPFALFHSFVPSPLLLRHHGPSLARPSGEPGRNSPFPRPSSRGPLCLCAMAPANGSSKSRKAQPSQAKAAQQQQQQQPKPPSTKPVVPALPLSYAKRKSQAAADDAPPADQPKKHDGQNESLKKSEKPASTSTSSREAVAAAATAKATPAPTTQHRKPATETTSPAGEKFSRTLLHCILY